MKMAAWNWKQGMNENLTLQRTCGNVCSDGENVVAAWLGQETMAWKREEK